MAIFPRLATVMLGLALLAAPPAVAQDAEPPDFGGSQGPFATPDEPTQMPDLDFTDIDGKPLKLSDLRGKVLLVNFWATWCAPCIKEMPGLSRLQAELGGADFQVVTISQDKQGARVVQPFFAKLGVGNLPQYLDNQANALRLFELRGLPTSFLVGRQGEQLGLLEGDADWDSDQAKALIRHYIDQR